MIYSSQELAYDKALSFFGYQAMDWNSNADYQADYTKLMQLYRNSPALQNGEIKLYQTSKAICSYRISSTEKILVLINISGNQERLNLPMERVSLDRRKHCIAKDDYVGALSILYLENRRII